MHAHTCQLIEALEGRTLMSADPYDFNGDGRFDRVTVTNSTTITVSLANADGSFTVSAILKVPKNQPIGGVSVADYNGDGKLDLSAGGLTNNRFYGNIWLGNGDGTFSAWDIQKSHPMHPHAFF